MERTNRELQSLSQRATRSLLEAADAGRGRTLLVGLSGGADSTALLFLLADAEDRHGWRVRAAHVDHGIQNEAIRTAFRATATSAARIAGVGLDVVAVDAASELAGGGGIEAAARRVRYRALAEIAELRHAELIAVAHTLDDQAETVLLHVIRGTGIDGLAAMPPIGPVPEVEAEPPLVRPLLGHTRAETRRVCELFGFEPAEDPANRDLTRVRNRLRQELLPLLREFNPRIETGLAELAASARGDRALLESQSLAALTQASLDGDEFGSLDRRALLDYPPALQARVLRAYAARFGSPLTAERTRAALAVLASGHGTVELGGERVLRVAGGRVMLEDGGAAAAGATSQI